MFCTNLKKLFIKQGKPEEGSEKEYRKLINNLPSVAFDSILQRQKLNSISENDGLFNAEYTDTCPTSVLTEEILDKKVIAYKLQLEKLIAKGSVPDKKYLEEVTHFIDFDVHSDRLFFTYPIFLHLKYS